MLETFQYIHTVCICRVCRSACYYSVLKYFQLLQAESIQVLDRRLEGSCLLLAAIHVGLVSRFGPPRREDKVHSCCSNTTQVDPVPAPGDQWMGKKKKLVNFAAALAR